MKRLKLFPKTFFYTLALTVLVVVLAHSLIYLLMPQMITEVTTPEYGGGAVTVSIREEKIVMQALRGALPVSLGCCLLIAVICSACFSRVIVTPVKRISACVERMMKLDRGARCAVTAEDEIGSLARNVNALYGSLLSTIEQLEREKDQISELERAKVDFLRAASHELKTPVTALNATLENMILGVGKYRDHGAYLPECKKMVERLSGMIREILEASKLHHTAEAPEPVDMVDLLEKLCGPYRLIAAAHQIFMTVALPQKFTVTIPVEQFRKAVSNILANAVTYTAAGGRVSVYMEGNSLIVENECDPIPNDELRRLFEPFYRPDFSRSRDRGGNGLGLYIVDSLLTSSGIPYSFAPMDSPPGMRFTIRL